MTVSSACCGYEREGEKYREESGLVRSTKRPLTQNTSGMLIEIPVPLLLDFSRGVTHIICSTLLFQET